ncbi:MAG: conjugal transfer protein TrbL family protein [Dehalococcoidia bacterium]
MQPPVPPVPLPDIPNPFDGLDVLNPRTWASDLVHALLTTIGEALITAMRGFTDWALGVGDGSLNFVTRTPAEGTYASPTVRSLWDYSRALVNAAFAVIVLWGGLNVMVKEHTRSPYHEAMELLPRLLLGALGANLSLSFARFLIDLNNAVAAGVGQVGLPGYDQATPTQEGIALIITALAYGIVSILLVLQMLMRLALLDLLIILSPVAMLLWVLPQTQGWFRWWVDLFPVTVFQQAIQVMTLRLGASLMVELTPGSVSNATLTLFLGIAVCWLTLKVPSLLHRVNHRAGMGSVVSLVLISRAVGGVITGAGGAVGLRGTLAAGANRGGGPRPGAQRGMP